MNFHFYSIFCEAFAYISGKAPGKTHNRILKGLEITIDFRRNPSGLSKAFGAIFEFLYNFPFFFEKLSEKILK